MENYPQKNSPFQIFCSKCERWFKRKVLQERFKLETYLCHGCRNKGEGNPFYGRSHSKEAIMRMKERDMSGTKNPFYGKQHTEETKNRIRSHPHTPHFGTDNGFYGRRHSDETKQKIIEANKRHQANLSEEEKELHRQKQAEGHRRRFLNNPDSYIQGKRNGGIKAASVSGKYKINQLEKRFLDKVSELGVELEYSVILDRRQYDFGNKEKKILIEINGDFWHGNPFIYSTLSERQKSVHEKDKEKKEWAESKGFKVLSFWEHTINHNIDQVLSEVRNAFGI